METINEADEYRRLEGIYAQMSDAQIEAMSVQIVEFTEIAQQALRAEISKRGLARHCREARDDCRKATRQALGMEDAYADSAARDAGSLKDPADPAVAKVSPQTLNPDVRGPLLNGFDPTAYDLFGIWNVDSADQARQIMAVLSSAEVKAYLGPENVESVEAYKGSYEDGVEIKVMKFHAKFAIEKLRPFVPSQAEEHSPDDSDYAVLCPKCNSRDIVFESIDLGQEKESACDTKFNWTCASCGHRWKDDGVAQHW